MVKQSRLRLQQQHSPPAPPNLNIIILQHEAEGERQNYTEEFDLKLTLSFSSQ